MLIYINISILFEVSSINEKYSGHISDENAFSKQKRKRMMCNLLKIKKILVTLKCVLLYKNKECELMYVT